jgi:hypothetical protein
VGLGYGSSYLMGRLASSCGLPVAPRRTGPAGPSRSVWDEAAGRPPPTRAGSDAGRKRRGPEATRAGNVRKRGQGGGMRDYVFQTSWLLVCLAPAHRPCCRTRQLHPGAGAPAPAPSPSLVAAAPAAACHQLRQASNVACGGYILIKEQAGAIRSLSKHEQEQARSGSRSVTPLRARTGRRQLGS